MQMSLLTKPSTVKRQPRILKAKAPCNTGRLVLTNTLLNSLADIGLGLGYAYLDLPLRKPPSPYSYEVIEVGLLQVNLNNT